MKQKTSRSYVERPILSQYDQFFYYPTKRKESIETKNQSLLNYKSSLEVLLKTIKNFESNYFSKQSTKTKTTKQMLILLKDNLNLMLKEKNKTLNYLKKDNDFNKKRLQNKQFPSPIVSKKKNNKNKMNNNKISYVLETEQLQLLNFQMQNEINKTSFLYEQKMQINTYIKSIPFFFETSQEIFCNNNYENYTKISELLTDIIRRVRKEFIEVVKEKMEKEVELNAANVKINFIKNSIINNDLNGCRKYIETEDIIQEESKEYTKTIMTNQSKKNSFSSNNNKTLIKKMSSISSGSSKNKYINKNKEKKLKDKLQRNIIYTNKINKDIFNDINNSKINNYLNMNMNINVNINLNNNNNNFIHESFNSSLDSGNFDENKEKNEQYEMDLNDNNKIIITPITTTENINRMNSRNNSIKSESNNNDSFILNIKDI